MSDRLPIGYDVAMNLRVCIGLSEQRHTERSKIGPEKEIQRMEGIGPSAGMLAIVLTTNLPLSCQFHSAVVEEAVGADLSAILYDKRSGH